jgi:hypothetical protein
MVNHPFMVSHPFGVTHHLQFFPGEPSVSQRVTHHETIPNH